MFTVSGPSYIDDCGVELTSRSEPTLSAGVGGKQTRITERVLATLDYISRGNSGDRPKGVRVLAVPSPHAERTGGAMS